MAPSGLVRRAVLAGVLGTAALPASLVAAARAALAACLETPRQTRGPFYPVRAIAGAPTDLSRTRPGGPRARGEILYLGGRVVDAACAPVAGARVEIWQADASGRYNHPAETRSRGPLDPGFGYWGEAVTDTDGRYAFTTIVPAPYSGRTAHIHFRIRAPKADLVTQMYFEGHPRNAGDFLLNALPEAERRRLLVALRPGDDREPGAKQASFDIVLPG